MFDNFILAEGLFAKPLQTLEHCVLVNNDLCWKLFSSVELPVTFEEIFKVPLWCHFLFLILIYLVANWTVLNLKFYIESFFWYYIRTE